MTPLLQVTDLTKYFPIRSGVFGTSVFGSGGGVIKAVDGVGFSVAAGETLGLVGESGCGKSTTGRLLMRLLEPTSGSIRLDGQEISELRRSDLQEYRRRVQMVFQNPSSSLNPRQSVGSAIAAPLLAQRITPPGGVKARVRDLMDRVGLRPDHYNRFPHEFSGGQKQRVGIARALALDPQLIICDEPVSALDVSVQAQVINLLADIQRDTGVAYVFIAHDLSVVKHFADRIAVMYLGRIMEQGHTDDVFDAPRHPYTRALLSAVPQADPAADRSGRIRLAGDLPSPADPPRGCVFQSRCPAHQGLDPQDRQLCTDSVPRGDIACHHISPYRSTAQEKGDIRVDS
ncbi:ABC transporter ATP-binding protein [Streptomyces purpurogeneiscleroticus]|uniref:ABC transporter ATP-binding protein n=1 Tax=Streptomyces purpurogeneiscleroticus TaxID=68259 RepID=UPI001CC01060|nr:oligopeptide/dipeptide ABC transporter ATP-binding protein [Streptomyces purpurogeneiscleroticus]MBZ4020766.1 peptide ABC transporter substrate-binding protein [Streptomyces purpurogeneiscleroticus]